jgi:hypothetical protein
MRHLQSFRYLKSIVETGSIRGAADNLAISPSALNRHIQTLEQDIDIKIFERLTHGVRLTPEGEMFFAYALDQLSGYKLLRNEIANVRGLQIGKINFAVSKDIMLQPILPLITLFQEDYQNVEIELFVLDPISMFQSLRNGDLDMALCVNPNLHRGLTVLGAKNTPIQSFIPNGVPISKSGIMRMYELNGIRVAMPPLESETAQRVVAGCERSHIDLKISYSGPNIAEYLVHNSFPVSGCFMVLDGGKEPYQISGYKRVALDEKEIGSCTMTVLANDEKRLTRPGHRFLRLLLAALES